MEKHAYKMSKECFNRKNFNIDKVYVLLRNPITNIFVRNFKQNHVHILIFKNDYTDRKQVRERIHIGSTLEIKCSQLIILVILGIGHLSV